MPHKAQLLVQLAQAAAKVETRQQGVLPSVAVNVWDTLTGTHAPSAQQQSAANAKCPAGPGPSAGNHHSADPRLPGGLGFLPFLPQTSAHPTSSSHAQQLLVQQAAAFHHWGMQPHGFPGHFAADTAALYDNSAWGMPQHSPQGPLLHAAGFAGLSRPAGVVPQLGQRLPAAAGVLAKGTAAAQQQQQRQAQQQQGGVRKARFSNSISLNKQIMNTHNTRDLHTIVRSKGSMFDFFNISSAIARVPKLVGGSGGVQADPIAKALVDDLANLMATHIDTFDARGLANSAWAFGKLKYAPSQKLPALIASAAIGKLNGFSAQNLSNLLWSFVYLHHLDEDLMTAVSKQVVAKVNEFKPQELANVVWALASMEHYSPELMEAVGGRALSMVDQFKEQELSNVVWGFAKLHHYKSDMFRKLLETVSHKLPHFLPQGVSNVAWALATAGHQDEALFKKLLAHCMADIGAYDVQGLSNLLWACATLGHKDTAFLTAATDECSSRMERMSSQNLSNVLWACATLGHADSRLLGNWAEAVMHKLDMFEPQGLSNSAWAFAKLGFSSPIMFEALAEAAVGKLNAFTPQGLSNTVWAYATVGHYHPVLMQQLAGQVLQQVNNFSAINCSNTLWAFASLRHYNPSLFESLLERLADHLDEVEPQNIANALYALARVNHPAGRHTGVVVSAAKRLMPRMNQQELCNTAWALGVLGQLDQDTWEEFCACVVNTQGLTPEGVHQAFHAQLMLHSEIARQAGKPLSSFTAEQLPTLPEPLAGHASHMWLASAVDVHVSKLQTDVSGALAMAGIPNTIEWLTDDGLFSIDIAFEIDGQNVAVEVDGSHHYTNSLPHMPLSEAVVRRRMLQDRGWKVVNVGYMEWEALPEDANTKAAALLQLLSSQLGPVDSWQRVGPPSRAPGSLVADAEAAQAAAAAEQRQQQLHQQRDMMLHGWKAGGSCNPATSSGIAMYGSAPGSVLMPGMTAGSSRYNGMGASVDGQGSWGALNSVVNPSMGFCAWGLGQDGLGGVSMPGGLGLWGSGALTGSNGMGAHTPSLLQQPTHMQQQQHAWDAFVATDSRSAAAAAAVKAEGCDSQLWSKDCVLSFKAAASSVGDGVASLPPSPSSALEDAAAMAPAGPDTLPGAEQLHAALAAAQQRWNNSPSSTQGSGGSGGSKKAAAFMWGDPTSANIWAP